MDVQQVTQLERLYQTLSRRPDSGENRLPDRTTFRSRRATLSVILLLGLLTTASVVITSVERNGREAMPWLNVEAINDTANLERILKNMSFPIKYTVTNRSRLDSNKL